MKEAELYSLAKSQLGLSFAPDSTVPRFYLAELKEHARICPNDTNFRVTLAPKHGLGTLTCLERGCDNLVVHLTPRAGVVDGGKSEGLGNFLMYRRHIYDHPTHKKARDERVKSQPIGAHDEQGKRPFIKREVSSLLKVLDTNSSSLLRTNNNNIASPSKSSALPATKRISTLTRINLEQNSSFIAPEQSKIQGAKSGERSCPHITPEVAAVNLVKTKTRSTPVTSQQNNTPRSSPSTTKKSLEELRQKLHKATHEISLILSKPNITAKDKQRMDQLRDEVTMDEMQMHYLWNSMMRADPFQSSSSAPYVYYDLNRLPPPQTAADAYTTNFTNPYSYHAPTATLSSSALLAPADDFANEPYVDQSTSDAPAQAALQNFGLIQNIAPATNAHHFDENGDFHGRGRDTFAGPKANREDMDRFLTMAVKEQFDGNATVDDALAKLGLRSQYDLIPGMAVPLMPHQTIGVAWMLEKEASKLKGGALCDEMGLGKTVQMIAVLIKNRPTDPLCKTNLIIAPAALLEQWKLEIELKTNGTLSCLIYLGQNRPRRKEELMKYDVVLTTFQTMSMEWFDAEKEGKRLEKLRRKRGLNNIPESDDEEDHMYTAKKRRLSHGLLFDIEFYRVVLDEAQNIRNRRTRMSRAVLELQTTYRWCLTGTPIVNSLADVYPYLRFIRVSPWHDFTEFQQHIGKTERTNPSLAVCRLQAIITTFLLRRMKDSKLDGKRLIELPGKEVGMVQLEFSPEEREIYRMVEIRSQARFNRFLRAGTVLKNYHQVLVLLLRLRQICSHPCLITENGNAFVKPGELEGDKRQNGDDVARAKSLVSLEFVEKMNIKLKEAVLSRVEAEKESLDAAIDDDECPICFDIRTDAVITPCTHIFCRECIMDVLHTPPVENFDEPMKYREDERPCPSCRSPISKDRLFSRAAFESAIDAKCRAEEEEKETDDLNGFIVPDDEHGARRRQASHEDDFDDPDMDLDAKVNRAVELMPRFLPSTKMKYMMEAISKILKEKPDEKVLLISQWTACLALVSEYLNESGIPHVKYQGDMRRSERDKAVREFMTEMKARVMLMSLKCGGVGLNLTRANNVILLDLAWSQAIEAQAFDRVHRLGQTRPVNVDKLVVSNTVEDRILQLQHRKQQLADGSLGEGSGKKIGRLTVRELANLFGLDVRGQRITN